MVAPPKGLVFRGPHDIRYEEVRLAWPGTGEVVLDVLAAGVCGSDVHGYTGESGRRQPGVVMGHEAVGRVSAIGKSVLSVREGDLVCFTPIVACGNCSACREGLQNRCPSRQLIGGSLELPGAFADVVRVPATNLCPWPEDAPLAVGAMVEPLAVGLQAIGRAGIGPATSSVLVVGAGMIGLAVAAAAVTAGAEEVLVFDTVASKAKGATPLGAVPLIVEPGGLHAALRARHPQGVDIAVDAVASSASSSTALRATKVGGVVCLVGLSAPEIELAVADIVVDERTLVGTYAYPHAVFRQAAELAKESSEVLSSLHAGTWPLADGPTLFAELSSGSLEGVKYTLAPAMHSDVVR